MDTGDPVSCLALAQGTPVYAADETLVGTVREVLVAEREDIFDGIVIDTDDGERFVDGDQAGRLFERAVILALSPAQVSELPPPSRNPAVIEVGADDLAKDSVRSDLRTEREAARTWTSAIGDWFRGLTRRR